jgi:hypothetical protein
MCIDSYVLKGRVREEAYRYCINDGRSKFCDTLQIHCNSSEQPFQDHRIWATIKITSLLLAEEDL